VKKLKPRIPLEREVQKAVIQLYRQAGCWVENRAQGYRKEAGGTRQTKGIPDLMVWPIQQNIQPWFHEVKRLGGKQSPEQVAYQKLSESRNLDYVLGGVTEALAHLKAVGLWK
jgi:hypothetical protein